MHERRLPIAGRVFRAAGATQLLLLTGCTALGLNSAMPPMMAPPPAPEVSEPTPLPEMAMMPEPMMGPEVASVMPPPTPTPVPKPPPPTRRPPPKPPEAVPARPNVVMSALLGSDFMSILNVFRSPDTVQNNNLSVVWTYSPPGCTLQLYFYPDITTTTFHLLKYDFRNSAGEALMSGDPCMQRMLAPVKGAAVQ